MCYNDLATDPTYSYHYYLSNVLPVNDVLAVALPDLLPALACKFVPKFLSAVFGLACMTGCRGLLVAATKLSRWAPYSYYDGLI